MAMKRNDTELANAAALTPFFIKMIPVYNTFVDDITHVATALVATGAYEPGDPPEELEACVIEQAGLKDGPAWVEDIMLAVIKTVMELSGSHIYDVASRAMKEQDE